MTAKQKQVLYIVISILVCILYFFIAASPIEEHLHLQPVWTLDITENIPKFNNPQQKEGFTHHFKLGQNMGYFDKDGAIGLFKTFPFKATTSDNHWAIYDPDTTKIDCYAPNGTQITTINSTGFPFFEENRMYVFHPSGNAVSLYNLTGKKVWTHEEPAIITAFDSSENGTVIGYSNGKIFYTDKSNTKTTVFSPGGSNHNVIFGVAISPDGHYVAALCGLEKQRIIVAQIEKSQTKIIYHEYLTNETKNQSLVYFSSDNKNTFIDTKGGLVMVNLKDFTSTHINLHSIATNIVECSIKETKNSDTIYAVLSKIENGYKVTLINKNAIKLGNFSFTAKNAGITSENNSLFVEKDTVLSRIDLIEN